MVKIVTDSSCDLSKQIINELDITVVPLFARFGEEVFRERVDLTEEEFYQKLIHGNVFPVTIQPNPQDFVDIYEKVSGGADAIVSIHISGKLSGTMNSAFQAKDIAKVKCPIELIDTESVSIGLGLIVLAAARVAKAGGDFQQVVSAAKKAIPESHCICLMDTLKYLQLGGRIGKAKALLGSLLNVKPMVTLKDGEVIPFGQARSRAKGLDMVYDFVNKIGDIDDLAVAYSTTPEDAQALAERLSSLYKGEIKVLRLGSTLGIHTGPGSLVVAVQGKIK